MSVTAFYSHEKLVHSILHVVIYLLCIPVWNPSPRCAQARAWLSNLTDHTRANPPAPVIRKECVCAKSLQSYLTFCDPVDYSSPCSSVHTFLQARILEWAAVPSSRGSSRPKDGTHVSWCLLHWHAGSLPLAPPGKLAGTLGWTSSLTSWGFILFLFINFFPIYFYPLETNYFTML